MNQLLEPTSEDPAWVRELLLSASIAVSPALIMPANQHQVSASASLGREGGAVSTVKVSRPSSSAESTAQASNLPALNPGLGNSATKPNSGTSVPPEVSKPVKTTTAPQMVWSVSSTSYCQGGTTASGMQTYVGEVAGNIWPLGTKLLILSGEHAGEVVTVEDHIGWGSSLDFFDPSCHSAIEYGREQIRVEGIG